MKSLTNKIHLLWIYWKIIIFYSDYFYNGFYDFFWFIFEVNSRDRLQTFSWIEGSVSIRHDPITSEKEGYHPFAWSHPEWCTPFFLRTTTRVRQVFFPLHSRLELTPSGLKRPVKVVSLFGRVKGLRITQSTMSVHISCFFHSVIGVSSFVPTLSSFVRRTH